MDMKELLEDVQKKYPTKELWGDLTTNTNVLDVLAEGGHISEVAVCAFLWGIKFSLENLQAVPAPDGGAA